MKVRILTSAFLICDNKVLLMKRGLHKKFGPGNWAGIGGHIEIEDIADYHSMDFSEACYRELKEETGIEKTSAPNLQLKYISIRKVDGEIRYIYHYFTTVETEFSLPDCDEGALFWIDKEQIDELPMTVSVKVPLMNWLENSSDEAVRLVVVNKENDAAKILAF